VVQRIETAAEPNSKDLTGATGLATSDPSHYWMLRSSWDISEAQELDFTLRRVGALASPAVPAYTAVDMRYGFRIRKGMEVSLVGQNLFDRRHAETGAAPGRHSYERNVLLKLVWTP
jgi:iron complex outermembrane receptor protein